MVKSSVILAVVIVAVLAVSAGYYINGVSGGNSKNSVTVDITATMGTVANGAPDTFSPRTFTVTEGQHVTIVFLNSDDDPHELAIPQFSVDTGVVQSGTTARVSFIASQAGTFQFYEPQGLCGNCTSTQEMTGNMTVLPP